MGQWTMVIEGAGPHHNSDAVAEDADKMMKVFVEDLKVKGHSITHATFTSSGRDEIVASEHLSRVFKKGEEPQDMGTE